MSQQGNEPATTDPRVVLGAALDQAERIVAEVRPDQLDSPTPCDEYDLRTLLGHLVAVLGRIDHVANGGLPFETPHIVTGIADDGFVTAYSDVRAKLDATLADDSVLDREVAVPWGKGLGREVLSGYVMELSTHGWDVATVIGRTDLLSPELAETVLPFAHRMLPVEPRGGPVPFGPVVEVPADADPYTQLVAYLGRTPASV